MSTGTPFRPRKTPITALLPKVVYMHVMDNTEGIPGNRPCIFYTSNKQNPFGRPGIDYSESFPWTFYKLVPAVLEQARIKTTLVNAASLIREYVNCYGLPAATEVLAEIDAAILAANPTAQPDGGGGK